MATEEDSQSTSIMAPEVPEKTKSLLDTAPAAKRPCVKESVLTPVQPNSADSVPEKGAPPSLNGTTSASGAPYKGYAFFPGMGWYHVVLPGGATSPLIPNESADPAGQGPSVSPMRPIMSPQVGGTGSGPTTQPTSPVVADGGPSSKPNVPPAAKPSSSEVPSLPPSLPTPVNIDPVWGGALATSVTPWGGGGVEHLGTAPPSAVVPEASNIACCSPRMQLGGAVASPVMAYMTRSPNTPRAGSGRGGDRRSGVDSAPPRSPATMPTSTPTAHFGILGTRRLGGFPTFAPEAAGGFYPSSIVPPLPPPYLPPHTSGSGGAAGGAAADGARPSNSRCAPSLDHTAHSADGGACNLSPGEDRTSPSASAMATGAQSGAVSSSLQSQSQSMSQSVPRGSGGHLAYSGGQPIFPFSGDALGSAPLSPSMLAQRNAYMALQKGMYAQEGGRGQAHDGSMQGHPSYEGGEGGGHGGAAPSYGGGGGGSGGGLEVLRPRTSSPSALRQNESELGGMRSTHETRLPPPLPLEQWPGVGGKLGGMHLAQGRYPSHDTLLQTLEYAALLSVDTFPVLRTMPLNSLRRGMLRMQMTPPDKTFNRIGRKDVMGFIGYKKSGSLTRSRRRKEGPVTFTFRGVPHCSLVMQRYAPMHSASSVPAQAFVLDGSAVGAAPVSGDRMGLLMLTVLTIQAMGSASGAGFGDDGTCTPDTIHSRSATPRLNGGPAALPGGGGAAGGVTTVQVPSPEAQSPAALQTQGSGSGAAAGVPGAAFAGPARSPTRSAVAGGSPACGDASMRVTAGGQAAGEARSPSAFVSSGMLRPDEWDSAGYYRRYLIHVTIRDDQHGRACLSRRNDSQDGGTAVAYQSAGTGTMPGIPPPPLAGPYGFSLPQQQLAQQQQHLGSGMPPMQERGRSPPPTLGAVQPMGVQGNAASGGGGRPPSVGGAPTVHVGGDQSSAPSFPSAPHSPMGPAAVSASGSA